MTDVAVEITVNGQRRRAIVEPRLTLADFIRERCQLTGTHLGCEHGVCGACTILLLSPGGTTPRTPEACPAKKQGYRACPHLPGGRPPVPPEACPKGRRCAAA